MKLKTLGEIIFIGFAIFGFVILGNIAHEFSHKEDFSEIDKWDEEICLLVAPTKLSDFAGPISYYEFNYNKSEENLEKIAQIQQYTEYKALALNCLILGVFVFSLIIFMNRNEVKNDDS